MTETQLRIALSEDLYQTIDKLAIEAGIPIEEFISKRLPQIATPSLSKPIVVNDEERRVLERLLGKNMMTGGDLIKMVEHALTLSVAEASVPLTPYLLDRLKSRCFGLPFEKFIALTVKRCLEEFVGIR